MGRQEVIKAQPVKKQCLKCEKLKNLTDFFLSNSDLHKDSKYPVCKVCLKENLDVNDIESVRDTLLQMNRPFLDSVWGSSLEESQRVQKEPFGLYLKQVQLNYKTFTWKDSDQSTSRETHMTLDASKSIITLPKHEFHITDELIEKWGDGYTPEEYRSFERKYNSLKNNYQEKTAMHTEALLTYIRYRVKEELATAKGDSKSAKEWGTLAKDAATAAKINPSQLSKSDLSDGLDTFGQLVRSVEQAVDIIEILPRFKEKPQDKVDFTLWCYINYIRDLKGLPLVEFKEIYEFYEIRKREYEDSNSDDDGDE